MTVLYVLIDTKFRHRSQAAVQPTVLVPPKCVVLG